MVVTRKNSTASFYQERLSKDDLGLLIEAIETSEHLTKTSSPDRIEMLTTKLKRMKSK